MASGLVADYETRSRVFLKAVVGSVGHLRREDGIFLEDAKLNVVENCGGIAGDYFCVSFRNLQIISLLTYLVSEGVY